jgi:predicted O-methyltransferase YrrM
MIRDEGERTSALYPEFHEKSTGTARGYVPVYLLHKFRHHQLRLTVVEKNAPKMITATSTLQRAHRLS